MKEFKEAVKESVGLRGVIVFCVNLFLFTILLRMPFGMCVCGTIIVWGLLEFYMMDRKKKDYERRGIIQLFSEEEMQKKREALMKKYDFACSCAKETAQERYHIDYSAISSYIDLGQRLAMNNVQTGMEMQKSKGPQTDWAIVGGLTSGLAGGAAGVAAAVDTMRQNEEATRKYHELGRNIVEQGCQAYQSLEKNRNDILAVKCGDLTCSAPIPGLIENLKVKILDTENYGVGYINATVNI
jgi:hypothetical protein